MADFPTIDFGPFAWANLDRNYIVKWNGKLIALNELQANIAAFGESVGQDRDQAKQAAITATEKAQQTGQDALNTAADVVLTGQDREQTGLDRQQTAADVEQTGEDRAASETAAGNANRDAQIARDAVSVLEAGAVVNGPPAALTAWPSQRVAQEIRDQSTRVVTLSVTPPPTVRVETPFTISVTGDSHLSISTNAYIGVTHFEVEWWDGESETVSALGSTHSYSKSATLTRAVDVPVGSTVTAAIRAIDALGNASAVTTISAEVVENSAPMGPITISAPTQVRGTTGFQVSFSGATDADADTLTYSITDSGGFTFSKTTGIAAGEIVDGVAPAIEDDDTLSISVVAVDAYGGQSATYSKNIDVFGALVIGVALRATGGPGGTWDHIDRSGNTITTPSTSWFNAHPIFGGIQDVSVDGQDMVEIPKFYWRRGTAGGDAAWWISDQPVAGFAVMPAFVLDGEECAAFQYGKYQGRVISDKLSSIPSTGTSHTPTVSRTLTEFIADAEARNVGGVAGFRLAHYDMLLAIQWLYLIENATMDSQTKTGAGRVNESALGTVSASDVATATYRGMVGLWGNVRQFIDGFRSNGTSLESRGYAGDWVSLGVSSNNLVGGTYPITFNTTQPIMFIPDTYSDTNDATATIPDKSVWRGSINDIVYFAIGGFYSDAADAGLWCIDEFGISEIRTALSARLARIVN